MATGAGNGSTATHLLGTLTSSFSGVESFLYKVLLAAVIFAAGLFIASFVRSIMRRNVAPRLPMHVYKPLENVTFYGLLFFAGIAALQPFGVRLSSLLVAGGFAGIVIGFASQNALSNLISGVMLLAEQPFKVGDPIFVAGVGGVVVNVGVLSTTIRTWDGTFVRIPNNEVFNSVITNYFKVKARRIEFTIGVHYNTDIDKALEVIKKLVDDHPFCLINPAPDVFVEEYADSSINLKVRCWAPPQVWFATKVELQTRIKKALDEAGIQIPYPQLDLHIISSKTEIPVRLKREEGEGGAPQAQ
ncbi:mechanosensitive ion channel family protein [Stetteria hydrogenophila]